VSELLAKKRIFLAREDAERIASLGRAASGPLLAILANEDASPSEVAAAASLLGAIGEPRAVRLLKQRLLDLGGYNPHEPLRYDTMLGEALACLGRAGLRALESLAHPDADVPSIREAAIDGLIVAQTPGTDDVLVRLFGEEENPDLCGILAQALCGRRHPQAVPLVDAALRAKRIAPYIFSRAEFNRWKTRGTLPHGDEWTPHTVAFFLPAHRAEFQRIEYDLLCQSQREMERATDLEYVHDLLSLRDVVEQRVRLERPCACGSGQVESACCETWLPLFSTMHWRRWGNRWLPSELYRDLPPGDFKQHLRLLSATVDEVRQALPGLGNDYLRWSAALRWFELRNHTEFEALAGSIATCPGPRHPALVYPHIYQAGRVRNQREFDDYVTARHLVHAWQWCLSSHRDPDTQEACFMSMRGAEPDFLWSAIAMAEIMDVRNARRVRPVLREALARARAGTSKGLPGLMEEACPVWVLERYLDAIEQRRALGGYRNVQLILAN
jgi:hypothetical protein